MFRVLNVVVFATILLGSALSFNKQMDTEKVVGIFQKFTYCMSNATSPVDDSQHKRCRSVRDCLNDLLSESESYLNKKNELRVKADVEKDLLKVEHNCELIVNAEVESLNCQMEGIEKCLKIPRTTFCGDLQALTYCLGPYSMNCTDRTFVSVLRRISLGLAETRKCQEARNMKDEYWQPTSESTYPSTYSVPSTYSTTDDEDYDDSYQMKPFSRMHNANGTRGANYTSGSMWSRDLEDDHDGLNSTVIQLRSFMSNNSKINSYKNLTFMSGRDHDSNFNNTKQSRKFWFFASVNKTDNSSEDDTLDIDSIFFFSFANRSSNSSGRNLNYDTYLYNLTKPNMRIFEDLNQNFTDRLFYTDKYPMKSTTSNYYSSKSSREGRQLLESTTAKEPNVTSTHVPTSAALKMTFSNILLVLSLIAPVILTLFKI